MRSQSGHLKDELEVEEEDGCWGTLMVSLDVVPAVEDDVNGRSSSKTLTMPRTSEQRFSFSLLVRVASRFKDTPAKQPRYGGHYSHPPDTWIFIKC